MADTPQKPDDISQEDWDAVDIPEPTDAELAQMRPFAEVFPEQYKAWKNKGGRPKSDAPRVHMGFRFPAELAAKIKAGGAGANGRVEAILQQAADEGRL